MAITKETVVNSITVLEDGRMQVQEATYFVEDGVRVGNPTYHRRVVDVGDDVTNEAQLVKDVAMNMHTSERIAARAAIKVKNEE